MSKLHSESAEGFICPYCLVSFASANKLQAHFIEFHNNEEADLVELNQEDGNQSVSHEMMHRYRCVGTFIHTFGPRNEIDPSFEARNSE